MKICLVDDDAALREAFTLIFTEEGYDVMGCADAATALQQSNNELPNVYLVDLNLTGAMNGEDLVKALRQQPKSAAIPIIVMSGVPDLAARAEQLEVEYLPKPSAIEVVLDKIKHLSIKT